jgi:hypothetical protein
MDYSKKDLFLLNEFETYINNKNWKSVSDSISDEFEAIWPQYKERVDKNAFIDLIKTNPYKFKIKVFNINHQLDKWEWVTTVIRQERILKDLESKKEQEDFIISFYEIQDEKIIHLVQYIAPSIPSDDWRSNWVKRY